MSYCYKYLISVCLLSYAATFLCGEQRERPLSAVEGFAVGAAVAGAEVILPGQIFAYGMNRAINKKPFVPSHCYRGFPAHIGSMVPVGAAQKMVLTAGAEEIEHRQGRPLSWLQKACVAYMAGVAGSVIDTPLNAVQLGLQDEAFAGKKSRDVMRSLGRNMARGWAPNAFMKEGPFVVGYGMLAAEGEQFMHKYTDNTATAKVVGGVGAGVVTAMLTQPGACLRTRMQADLFDPKCRAPYKSTMQTARDIIKAEGVAGLWGGWKQRSLRMVFAVPLYAAYTSFLENTVREYRK